MAEIVTLDVGGVVYRTKLATLTLHPDSMLGAILKGKDDQGRFFIDRDGSLFRHVLNFLRCSKLVLPEDFKELDMLAKEAAFYRIKPLIKAIDKVIQERRPEQCNVETLELEQVGASMWMLRGLKSTLNALHAFSKDGDTGWTCRELEMGFLNANVGIIGEAVVNITAWRKDPMVTRIRSVIEHLGLKFKRSTSNNGFMYVLFQRTLVKSLKQ